MMNRRAGAVIMTKYKATRPDRIAVYFTSTPLTAFFRQYEAARMKGRSATRSTDGAFARRWRTTAWPTPWSPT